jgi:hypothetical protein
MQLHHAEALRAHHSAVMVLALVTQCNAAFRILHENLQKHMTT